MHGSPRLGPHSPTALASGSHGQFHLNRGARGALGARVGGLGALGARPSRAAAGTRLRGERRLEAFDVSILRLSAFWSSVSAHPASIPKHPCSHQPRSLILRLLHDLDDYVERNLSVLAREALKPRRGRARLERSSQFILAHARCRLLV
jgi:hypothetical protein